MHFIVRQPRHPRAVPGGITALKGGVRADVGDDHVDERALVPRDLIGRDAIDVLAMECAGVRMDVREHETLVDRRNAAVPRGRGRIRRLRGRRAGAQQQRQRKKLFSHHWSPSDNVTAENVSTLHLLQE